MLATLRYFFIALSIACFCSCNTEINPTFSYRSGPLDNDDVEEPLSEMVQSLEPALDLSNKILNLVISGKSDKIYDNYVDSQIKDSISREGFKKLIESSQAALGKPLSYKPMQWNFQSMVEQKLRLLNSYKILRCEKGSLNYTFTFRFGSYDKIIGLKFLERNKNG